MERVEGLGVSPGVAIGRAVCLQTRAVEVYRLPLSAAVIDDEVERLRSAIVQAKAEILDVQEKVRDQLGEELGAIFEAHSLFLDDPVFLDRIEERIRREQVNAEWAVYRVAHEMEERFAAIENEYFRDRREDLRDVALQLLRSLQGISNHELSEIEGEVVIVADELTPSYALRLGREKVRGFAIEAGGRTSHTTIIARSLNIPAITGLEGILARVTDDDPLILDGESGALILHPTAEVMDRYRSRQQALEQRDEQLLETRSLKACTDDGTPVVLMANIDLPEEIETAVRYGAAGVGLYRSEFLYIESSPRQPTEDEHLELYRRLVETSAPYPAIIRTYDLGGKKMAQELLHTQREENPVLGLRGIRLTLALREMFKIQMRALYRAAVYGDLWVMIPMVSSLEEVRQFHAFCEEVMAELEAEGVPFRRDLKLGIMVEVPAAAMIAEQLAAEVDFFAIGTNDLIQYSMAVDRNNEQVASLYQPLHPGLLRMVHAVTVAAQEAGIEVSVCGEMASDPRHAALLVGLGLRRLSMSPRMVPAIKTQLRELCLRDLAPMAQECLGCGSATEVAAVLDRWLSPPLVESAERQVQHQGVSP